MSDQKYEEITDVTDVTEVVGGNTKPRPNKKKIDKNPKNRHWRFTAYVDVNYDILWMKYLIIGDEICPTTGRPHKQGHVYTISPMRFTQLQKKLPGVSFRTADYPEESIQYCKKDGKFKEWGTKPEQGKRHDLVAIKDDIVNGMSVDSIVMDDPMSYHKYGRTLNKIEDIMNSKKKRDFRPVVTWIYGPTGTGKSHSVYEKEKDLYVKCFNDDKWWDGYNFHEAVLLDDYRGEMKYNDMLQFLDKYQYTVPRRGRAPISMMAKRIYITSSKKPEEVYLDNSDCIDQLMRRITTVTQMTVRYVDVNDNEDESL